MAERQVANGCRGQEKERANPAKASSVQERPDSVDYLPEVHTVQYVKRKPYIFHDLKTPRYESFSPDGTPMQVNWTAILKSEKLSKQLKAFGLEYDNSNARSQVINPQLNPQKIQADLAAMDCKVTLKKIKKAGRLTMDTQILLPNSVTCDSLNVDGVCSNYIAYWSRVNLIDSALLAERKEEYWIAQDEYLFSKSFLKVYRTDGGIIADLSVGNVPFSPAYLFLISDDERFILIGSVVNLGDDEGYMPDGPFHLFDLKTKEVKIFPALDTNDTEKFPHGVGYLKNVIFKDSFFQIFYDNDTSGVWFLIDPYQRKIYYRNGKWQEFGDYYHVGGKKVKSPILRNGQLKNIEKYRIVSY
jgi:hypothetical protein